MNFTSTLVLKRTFSQLHATCSLVAPTDVASVQAVYEQLWVCDSSLPINPTTIPWIGALARAACKKLPLLIIDSASPQFVGLESIVAVQDEVALDEACCFALRMVTLSSVFLNVFTSNH